MNGQPSTPAHQVVRRNAFAVVAEMWAHEVLAKEDSFFRYTKPIFIRADDRLRLPDGSLVRRGEWVIRIDGVWRRSLDGRPPAPAGEAPQSPPPSF